jgi:hypothetical protein
MMTICEDAEVLRMGFTVCAADARSKSHFPGAFDT